MSSYANNEFHSLCVAVFDAAACNSRKKAPQAEISDIFELDSSIDFPYSLTSLKQVWGKDPYFRQPE